MTTHTEVLKPCPFCGNEAMIGGDDRGGRYAVCKSKDCYAAVGENYDRYAMPDHWFRSEEDAIAAWNRRPAQASEAAIRPDPTEVLRDDCAQLMDENRMFCAQLASIRKLIADDAFASSFQTLWQYRSALLRALSTTPAEPVENGWLPIESAPVDKEILLTATLHNMLTPKPQRVVGRKDSRGGWWSTCGQTLSHMQCWQPLPPPPYSQRNE